MNNIAIGRRKEQALLQRMINETMKRCWHGCLQNTHKIGAI
jgi:hypothetical protein